ncbi:MAG: hypothetical protein WBQ25_21785 [Nitrososphaeraceae archaeon]
MAEYISTVSALTEPVGFHCPAGTHAAGYSDTSRGSCVSNEAGLDYIPASGDNIFKINCVPGWHEKPNGSGACEPDGTPTPPPAPTTPQTCSVVFNNHPDTSGKCVDDSIPLPNGACANGREKAEGPGYVTCNLPREPGKKPECVGEVYIDVHTNKCVSADVPKPDGSCVTGYEKSAADSNLCEPVGFHCPAGTHATGYSDTSRGSCVSNEAGLPMTPDDNGFIGACSPGWHFVRTKDYVHCEPDVKPTLTTPTGNTVGSTGATLSGGSSVGTTTGGTTTPGTQTTPTTQTGTSGTGGTTTGTGTTTNTGNPITPATTTTTTPPTSTSTSTAPATSIVNNRNVVRGGTPECVPGFHWDNSQLKCVTK